MGAAGAPRLAIVLSRWSSREAARRPETSQGAARRRPVNSRFRGDGMKVMPRRCAGRMSRRGASGACTRRASRRPLGPGETGRRRPTRGAGSLTPHARVIEDHGRPRRRDLDGRAGPPHRKGGGPWSWSSQYPLLQPQTQGSRFREARERQRRRPAAPVSPAARATGRKGGRLGGRRERLPTRASL